MKLLVRHSCRYHAIVGRHIPGTFTNQFRTPFNKSRLLFIANPRTNRPPIKEVALGNTPTFAFSVMILPSYTLTSEFLSITRESIA